MAVSAQYAYKSSNDRRYIDAKIDYDESEPFTRQIQYSANERKTAVYQSTMQKLLRKTSGYGEILVSRILLVSINECNATMFLDSDMHIYAEVFFCY